MHLERCNLSTYFSFSGILELARYFRRLSDVERLNIVRGMLIALTDPAGDIYELLLH